MNQNKSTTPSKSICDNHPQRSVSSTLVGPTLPIIVEEENAEKANQLALSGEFCQPRFSEKRNCYILIRRKA